MTVKGVDELNKISVGIVHFSKEVRQAALATGRTQMNELRDEAVMRTPKDTGEARSKWSQVIEAGDTLYFELNVPYGMVLDKGSTPGSKPWPTVGPKTELYKGKIFSSQVADGEGGITAEVLDETKQGEIANAVLESVYRELINAVGR